MNHRLHPLNTNFTWRRSTGPFRLLTPKQARIYDDFGFVVLEQVFDAATIAALTEELDGFEAQAVEHLKSLSSGDAFISRFEDITFTTHLVKRSKFLRDFCSSRFFQDLTHDLIGPDVRLYWDQAVYKKMHAKKPFPWHQDNGYLFVEPQQYVTCWVALTDANESNGCVWVCPGMHKYGTLAHETNELGHWCFETDPPEAIPVPVRAGSVLVFSAITPHYTGPNLTSRTRKSYILQYAPEGACGIAVDGQGQLVRRMANVPDRQFPILVGGRPPAEATSPAEPVNGGVSSPYAVRGTHVTPVSMQGVDNARNE